MEVLSNEFPDLGQWFEAPASSLSIAAANSSAADVDLGMFESEVGGAGGLAGPARPPLNQRYTKIVKVPVKLVQKKDMQPQIAGQGSQRPPVLVGQTFTLPVATTAARDQPIRSSVYGDIYTAAEGQPMLYPVAASDGQAAAQTTAAASVFSPVATSSSSPEPVLAPMQPRKLSDSEVCELQQMLIQLDQNPNRHNGALSQIQEICGCNWSNTGSCPAGDNCEFVRQMLGLQEFTRGGTEGGNSNLQHTATTVANTASKPRILVMKQTSQGLVKVFDNTQGFTEAEMQSLRMLEQEHQQRGRQDQMMHQQAANTRINDQAKGQMDIRLLNIPTPSPSPPSLETHNQSICPECQASFRDAKAQLKHRRNHHQIYVCKECGEQIVGYYKMASHSKRQHSKEPLFHCECGRNFGEKKGIAKHQNTCEVYKKSVQQQQQFVQQQNFQMPQLETVNLV